MAFHRILNAAAEPEEVPAGGTVQLSMECQTAAGVLMTPATTKVAHIFDPDEVEVASSPFTVTFSATGKGTYNYATSASLRPGHYRVHYNTSDSGDLQELDVPQAFKVT